MDESIINMKRDLHISKMILVVAKQEEGKRLNKHFFNKVVKYFESNGFDTEFNRVLWDCSSGMINITIWFNNEYENRVSYFIGYDSECNIDAEKVEKNLQSHLLNEERIEVLKKERKNIPAWVEKYNKAIELLNKLEEETQGLGMPFSIYGSFRVKG